jgi:antitoxin VapB
MKSTVFKNNRTQAVRIPKVLAFPDDVKEVEIVRDGDTLVITPKPAKKKMTWDDFFAQGRRTSDDFMAEIEELPQQERDFKWD